jgi:glucose/arabinose dehydrogenase
LSCAVLGRTAKLRTHKASLEMVFYPTEAKQFPSSYDGDGFAAEHGSWNRKSRAGYEVIRIPMHDGHADGSYEDCLTGFVTVDGQVWGRPVGVAIANGGCTFLTDDGARSVWYVTYTGK